MDRVALLIVICTCLWACTSPEFLRYKAPYYVKGKVEGNRYCLEGKVCIYYRGLEGAELILYKNNIKARFTVNNKVFSTLSMGTKHKPGEVVSKEGFFQEIIAKIDRENERRKELLRGSLEEYWERVGTHEFIRKQAWDRGRHFYHMGNAPGDEQEKKRIKDIVLDQIKRKRMDLQGVPDDFYKRLWHKGLDCLYTSTYYRLPGVSKLGGKYKKSTAGGINSVHGYRCYVNEHTTLGIGIDSEVPPGEDFDANGILNKVFNTLELNSKILDYDSSFDQWLSEKYIEDPEK